MRAAAAKRASEAVAMRSLRDMRGKVAMAAITASAAPLSRSCNTLAGPTAIAKTVAATTLAHSSHVIPA